MATNKKISEYDELTSPATGDLVLSVDVSDTTHSADGTTKKTLMSTLTTYFEGLILTATKIKAALGISTLSGSNTGDEVVATGAEVDTGSDNDKMVTPKAMEDSSYAKTAAIPVKATATENAAGTDNAKYLTALANVPAFNNSLARQAIINGNFDVWQRGTSFNYTDSAVHYIADRWTFFNNTTTNANATISRQTASALGSVYGLRIQRTAEATYASQLYLHYALETADSIKFRGQKTTFSFWLKVGANWAGGNIVVSIRSGTGTDEKSSGFTGDAAEGSVTITPTTTLTKYTVTTSAVLDVSKTQLGIRFATGNFSGTAGANDWFQVEQTQLCAGDVALPFMPKSFEEELRACQRYYEKSFSYAVAPAQNIGDNDGSSIALVGNTNRAMFDIRFKVQKRTAAPVMTFYNPLAANASARNLADGTDTPIGGYGDINDHGGRAYTDADATDNLDLMFVNWVADSEL